MPRSGDARPPRSTNAFWRSLAVAVVAVLALAALWYAGRQRAEPGVRIITIYAFSALQGVLDDAVLPAFGDEWRRRTGERVEFVTTFGGSGRLVDRLVRETRADVAILASEIDAIRLQRKGILLGENWRHLPHGGVPFRTPVVLLVRPGNPTGVATLQELPALGASVVLTDPLSSGIGEWTLLACFATSMESGGELTAAGTRFADLWRGAESLAPSCRQSSLRFGEGSGDVLVTYEAEAWRLVGRHAGLEVVVPPRTMLCEPVVVRLPRHVDPQDAAVVEALIGFLWSPDAQRLFAEGGFRPVGDAEPDARLPALDRALTLADLGGSEAAERGILVDVWTKRILPTRRESGMP
jgi:sulfate transport system substrate-binding protein